MHSLKRAFSWLLASVAAIGLASCAVGPDFVKPTVSKNAGYTAEPLPAATASADIAGGGAQTFATDKDVPAQWWTSFGSDGLDKLVSEALKNNPNLQAAEAALEQAEYIAAASSGGLFPAVSTRFDARRSGPGINVNGTSGRPSFGVGSTALYSVFSASATLSYVLDVFGGVRRNIEAQHAAAEYQEFQMEAAYLSLTSNVLTTAIREAQSQAQIVATQDIIKSQSDALDLLNQQFELGAVARGDVLAQQSQLEQTQASLPPLQKQLAQYDNQMAALLGRFPNQSDFAKVDLNTLTLPEKLPVSVPAKLVNQRPDIRAAQATLHEATAQVGVATANMLPSLTLTASYGSAGQGVNNLSVLGNSTNLRWQVGAGVVQPLFEGGTLYNQREAAKAGLDKSIAQYRNTVLTAFQDVANVLRALELDAEALRTQLVAEQTASESLDITNERFRAGAISYLSLLDAERTYQQARIALVQAQANRYADTVALFAALGGGWWNRNDTLAANDSPPTTVTQIAPVSGPPVAASPQTATLTQPVSTTESVPRGQDSDGHLTNESVPEATAIYVQAGAYASLDNAQRVAARLASLGARISPIMTHDRQLYRVRIGPLQDPKEAQDVLMSVHKLGHDDAGIVVE